MIKEYVLIEESRVSNLNLKANELIKKGWTPYGEALSFVRFKEYRIC